MLHVCWFFHEVAHYILYWCSWWLSLNIVITHHKQSTGDLIYIEGGISKLKADVTMYSQGVLEPNSTESKAQLEEHNNPHVPFFKKPELSNFGVMTNSFTSSIIHINFTSDFSKLPFLTKLSFMFFGLTQFWVWHNIVSCFKVLCFGISTSYTY